MSIGIKQDGFCTEVQFEFRVNYSTDFALLQTMTEYSTALPQVEP